MKRVILDTNIYGLIIVDESIDKLKEDLDKKNIFIVYGFPLIRKELRDTPKSIKLESANLRNRLLSIYDEITKNHTLKLTSNIGKLSDSYFDIYKKIGGHASKNEMIKDLTIVACASLNLLDIVVSNDNKTMLSEKAVDSYNIVNQIKNIKTPRFISYEQFKKEIR